MSVTINGSTGISGVDGSASTPAYQGGDSDTGVFFPAADTIAFAEGGAEVARFDDSGRLLVGVTSATANGGVLELSGGITFPATAVAASNANTLDDYEEGTWTPVDASGANLSLTADQSSYTKIGRLVIAATSIVYPSTANGSAAKIGGFPFTIASNTVYGCFARYTSYTVSNILTLPLQQGTTNLEIYDGTSAKTNANVSTLRFDFVAVYIA